MAESQSNDDGIQVEPQDMVSLKALSNEDFTYIANNQGYRAMLQDILSPIIWENSGSADNTAPSNFKGRGTDNIRSTQRTSVSDQHS